MVEQFCPECGGALQYDPPTKRFACRGCGLYATREDISAIRDRIRESIPEAKKKRREQQEYLEWWLSKK